MNIAILAGGKGSRLWPLSQKNRPKQFTAPIGDQTLLRATIQRALAIANADNIAIVGPPDQTDLTWDCTQATQGAGKIKQIHDPGCGTAIAVGKAAFYFDAYQPDEPLAILPSDHWIENEPKLAATLTTAAVWSKQNRLILIGKRPTDYSTGYGFIAPAKAENSRTMEEGEIRTAAAFTEKPNAQRALLAANDGWLWNMGIVVATPRVILEEIRQHAEMEIVDAIEKDWPANTTKSFDVAVLEKSHQLSVVRYGGGWSDVGNWRSVHEAALAVDPDDAKVTTGGSAHYQQSACHNIHMHGSRGQRILAIGVSNLAIVASGDDILVVNLDAVQEVRNAEQFFGE